MSKVSESRREHTTKQDCLQYQSERKHVSDVSVKTKENKEESQPVKMQINPSQFLRR